MKNLKKVAGLAIVLAFPLLAVTVVMAQSGENRQDGENASKKGLEMRKTIQAKNIKIHPRIPIHVDKGFFTEYPVKGNPHGDKEKPSRPGGGKMAATGIPGAGVTGEKYAIVIGICQYPEKAVDSDGKNYGNICISDGDAKYMARALHTEYNFPVKNIYLFRDLTDGHISTGNEALLSKSASRENIMSAMDELRGTVEVPGRVEAGDEVVFFFSGHGVTGNIEGSGEDLDEALLVHNGIPNIERDKSGEFMKDDEGEYVYENQGGEYEYIWDEDLRGWFDGDSDGDGFATDRITFIFDTCKAEGMNDVMRGAEEGLNGRMFVAATTETGSAYVFSSGDDGEGVFSHFFVKEGIRGDVGPGGGYADGYNQLKKKDPNKEDGFVAIEEAYEYAKKKVVNYLWAGAGQIPVINDLFNDDLLLGYYL